MCLEYHATLILILLAYIHSLERGVFSLKAKYYQMPLPSQLMRD